MPRVPHTTKRDQDELLTYARPSDFYYEYCSVDNRTGRWYDWGLAPLELLPHHPRRDSGPRRPSDAKALVRVPLGSGAMSGPTDTRHRVRFERKETWAPPIGSAMSNLHIQLEAAELFYSDFISGFDGDIGQLKYLSEEKLDEIWTSKVAGVNRREAEDTGGEVLITYAKEFVEMARKVDNAIQYALQATVREAGGTSESTARILKLERLQDKVTLASTHIHDLTKVASKARAHCQDLVEELQSLKLVIDPENNKAFYKHDRPYEDEEECEI